jgi:hypothetical protein
MWDQSCSGGSNSRARRLAIKGVMCIESAIIAASIGVKKCKIASLFQKEGYQQ